ncbi:GNAT family N-acetyltransferase [Jeotgalibacillus sp. S-D1]|uniref:GNAT family N-acetyltransferase n=1 Tax=Jeotgalibacillus sp. S-D1 TaxID=2552189 RepID=UPI001059397B|nr:GNAT family N-acetyltransferase [Jeotgalibacillus sp. S-D1]TDL31523.1 GNAT family N-acetyltransferase [Jeotgalibacillus sp. S-D1]
MKWTLKTFNELSTYELYQILMLRNSVFVVEQQCAYQEIDGNDLNSFHLSFGDGEQLAAYARLLPAGVKYNTPSIGRIIVHESFRGSGIARELVSKSIDVMQNEWNVSEIKLQAQTYLRHFYQSFGFEETSEDYLDDGIPHVDMLMKVKQPISKGSE